MRAIMTIQPIAYSLILFAFTACSSANTAGPGATSASRSTPELGPKKSLGGIAVSAPVDWVESKPSSSMRRAQWTIGEGDAAAQMVIYYFGNTGAGSLEANLDRWYSQFEQSDGRATKDAAETTQHTVAGLPVTTVDVGGRYVAAIRPGAEERHDKPDWHMLAAVVQAPEGAYYFKMVGPRATVVGARSGFEAMRASIVKQEDDGNHPPASPHG